MTTESTALQGQVLDAMPAQQLIVQTSPYLTMMERIVDKGGDLAQLDKLLDLNLKWEANEARKAFVAAMASFKAEPMEILKRKLVSFRTNDGKLTEYSHAELADATDVVVPAMGKHGLSHRWDVKQEGGQVTVTCVLTHALGHSETVSMTAAPDDSGKKNAIQKVASAVTYLQRYTLLAITGMATKSDHDDDGRGAYDDAEAEPERISEAQEAKLREIAEAAEAKMPALLAHLKVAKLSDLLAVNYEPAMKILRQKLAANEKAKTA